MALAPAPHPPPVFRVLKQAWRDYLATNTALILTVSNPPNQLATATTPVSGTATADPSVPRPIQVAVSLAQSGNTKATQTVSADAVTGAFSVTFPASTLAAGSASASVSAPYASTQTSNNFTVT
jgi:hypothetical protein